MAWTTSCAPTDTSLLRAAAFALLAGLLLAQPAPARAACQAVAAQPAPQARCQIPPQPLFPFALRPLRCALPKPAPTPRWICESVTRLKKVKGCSQGSLGQHGMNPYADTFFDRHSLVIKRAPALHKRLRLIYLSQDAQQIEAFINDLLRLPQQEDKYIFGIAALYLLMRTGNAASPAAHELLKQLRQMADMQQKYGSEDLAFLTMYLKGASTPAAMSKAAASDRNFNRLAYQANQAMAAFQRQAYARPRSCMRAFDAFMNIITDMVALAPCPKMIAHVENYIYRSMPAPQNNPLYLAFQVYSNTLAWNLPRARRALQRFQAHDANIACKSYMQQRLQEFLTMAERQLERRG